MKIVKKLFFVGVLVALLHFPLKIIITNSTRNIDQSLQTNIVEIASRDKNGVYEYWKSTLNTNQKAYYDELKNSFANFDKEMYTKQKDITSEESSQTFSALYLDHPEMYWLGNINITYYRWNKKIKRSMPIKLEYRFSKEEVNKYNSFIEQKTNMIVERANQFQTDEEKIKYVHDELILMTEYEFEKDYSAPYYQSLVSLFNEGKAVCSGYTFAFKHIMDKLNIESVSIIGESFEQNHVWNKVKVNGEWKNVDVTWDDYGSIMIGSSYYLLEDEIFNQSHRATIEFRKTTG